MTDTFLYERCTSEKSEWNEYRSTKLHLAGIANGHGPVGRRGKTVEKRWSKFGNNTEQDDNVINYHCSAVFRCRPFLFHGQRSTAARRHCNVFLLIVYGWSAEGSGDGGGLSTNVFRILCIMASYYRRSVFTRWKNAFHGGKRLGTTRLGVRPADGCVAGWVHLTLSKFY